MGSLLLLWALVALVMIIPMAMRGFQTLLELRHLPPFLRDRLLFAKGMDVPFRALPPNTSEMGRRAISRVTA